mmetsp:Transcript_12136/g.24826  ORF Transcript_12136/g.24826 Transcript_12136/m.24826 type:complete len:314 (-) Transcript_12136:1940-2881(-)
MDVEVVDAHVASRKTGVPVDSVVEHPQITNNLTGQHVGTVYYLDSVGRIRAPHGLDNLRPSICDEEDVIGDGIFFEDFVPVGKLGRGEHVENVHYHPSGLEMVKKANCLQSVAVIMVEQLPCESRGQLLHDAVLVEYALATQREPDMGLDVLLQPHRNILLAEILCNRRDTLVHSTIPRIQLTHEGGDIGKDVSEDGGPEHHNDNGVPLFGDAVGSYVPIPHCRHRGKSPVQARNVLVLDVKGIVHVGVPSIRWICRLNACEEPEASEHVSNEGDRDKELDELERSRVDVEFLFDLFQVGPEFEKPHKLQQPN